MLSNDLIGLVHVFEKQINNSPTYEFKLSGTSALSMLSVLDGLVNQAIELEKSVVPDRLKQLETISGENVVRLDHWKATQPAKRKV